MEVHPFERVRLAGTICGSYLMNRERTKSWTRQRLWLPIQGQTQEQDTEVQQSYLPTYEHQLPLSYVPFPCRD
jgi:hypothetical protein